MSLPRRQEALILVNKKGGSYQPGRSYNVLQKKAIADKYVELRHELHPREPSIKQVADAARVSWETAKKVIEEVGRFGHVLDDELSRALAKRDTVYTPRLINLEQEMFLLAMRAEDHMTTNQEYSDMLYDTYGIDVSPQFITHWFQNRYEFKSKFKQATFTPLDKFEGYNWGRWVAFTQVVNRLDHTQLNWLDEKHFVNSDVYFQRGRSDPLTGRVDGVRVGGNFCEAYNCFAAVSANPQKQKAMVYSVGRHNGDSFAFLQFIEFLISSSWLLHNDVVVMDNASIHSMGEADIVEDLLWTFVRDGRPLNVLVVYLPARAPELNPIELCFHILVQRARKFRRLMERGRYVTPEAIACACIVMDNFDAALVGRCARHCGYRL